MKKGPEVKAPQVAHIWQVGKKLEPFVAGPESLSPEGLAEIKKMRGTDPVGFFSTALIAWLSIALAVVLAEYVHNIVFTIVAVCFIATRQNVIALLIHEQTHLHGIFAPWGDYVANLLCAYPLTVSVEGYRRVHLSHHTYFFDDKKDPDYIRKQGPEWTFPQKVRRFIRMLIGDAMGLNTVTIYKSKQSLTLGKEFDRTNPTVNFLLRLTFYIVVLSTITYFGLWRVFLIYWALPLVTVFQVLIRWGAICEHKYNLETHSVEEATPMISHQWWEKILLPNLNFNYHVYHHWWPAIPFTRLPDVEAVFKREGLVREELIFHGYIPYLKYLLGSEKPN